MNGVLACAGLLDPQFFGSDPVAATRFAVWWLTIAAILILDVKTGRVLTLFSQSPQE